MEVTVLVDKIDAQRYRVVTSSPIVLETEGNSREEAVERLRDVATQRLAEGELIRVSIPVSTTDNPWLAFAGVWKHHPDFDAYLENIAEYRREVDESEDDASA